METLKTNKTCKRGVACDVRKVVVDSQVIDRAVLIGLALHVDDAVRVDTELTEVKRRVHGRVVSL